MCTDDFKGTLVVLGYGGVASCLVELLVQHCAFNPQRLRIIDQQDKRPELAALIAKGARFSQDKLTRSSVQGLISELASPGDIVIDLTVSVDSLECIRSCQQRGVLYLNAALEEWVDQYAPDSSPQQRTLYARHQALAQADLDKQAPTALLDCGANPGLVSHFAKQLIEQLARQFLPATLAASQPDSLNHAEWHARLAQQLAIQTLHISEIDTQAVNGTLPGGTFYNTWSIDGLVEEALAPSELGWGSLEKQLPDDALLHTSGPQNQICLKQSGYQTVIRTWVPSGELQGMVIRHGEAYTLSKYLSIGEGLNAEYRPTVHYAYRPCVHTLASLREWAEAGCPAPERQVLLRNELSEGYDELGVLALSPRFGAHWFGTTLSIARARAILPGHNATTLQVAAGLLGGLDFIIHNPKRGLCTPEDMDHQRALAIAEPYLGKLHYATGNWRPEARNGFGVYDFNNLRV